MLSPLTRNETILVLNSLGIDVPTDTKLLDDILEKRLSDALAAAQYKDRLPDAARYNLDEASKLYADVRAGRNIQNALFVDPFVDLRQTMTDIAKFLDLGIRWCLIQDEPAQESAILLRKMLLKILKTNSSLVPPDYNVTRGPLEERFKVSVLLPVGPLEYDALSKLNNNMGCTVCGKRASSRCSSCQSVSYCDAACQRADWAQHKPACRSLRDATWRTVQLRAGVPEMEDCWFGLMNRHTSLANPVHKQFLLDDARPCVDVYGGRPFLAKMQISPPTVTPGRIMVYDRRQTFLGFLREDVDLRAFAECAAEIQGPRGGLMGLKMYRWARRTGDWELSVCLDRAVADAKW
ncbi:hypothetical protein GSI_08965 [Ganoderma sinense ZZ0214-1]|uniref:MYND-type domain-containing protein n=1 Tax=Ganoderma sinense ZZ0214-1 TaxID=1077348 RepID=A0A2G8S5V4_9APHY|nr:hypothetical protein GSI_08965 [Ganoderma sinense ZZ0214-1]